MVMASLRWRSDAIDSEQEILDSCWLPFGCLEAELRVIKEALDTEERDAVGMGYATRAVSGGLAGSTIFAKRITDTLTAVTACCCIGFST